MENQNPGGRPSLGDGRKQAALPRGEGLNWCAEQANVFAPAMLVSSDPLILDGCPPLGSECCGCVSLPCMNGSINKGSKPVPKVHSPGVLQWKRPSLLGRILEAICCYPGSLLIEWGSHSPPSLSKPAFQLGGAPISKFLPLLTFVGRFRAWCRPEPQAYPAALPINQVKDKGALCSCHRPELLTRSLITLGPAVPGAMPAEVPEPILRLSSELSLNTVRPPD